MIAKMSELFEVDIESIIEDLQELSSTAGYLQSNIREGAYLKSVKAKITLSQEIRSLEKIAYGLVNTFVLINRKLDRYRPNDKLSYSYLLRIQRYIDYLNKLVKEVEEEFQKDLNYGFDMSSLYEDLEEIKTKALEAEELIKRAISEGAFM